MRSRILLYSTVLLAGMAILVGQLFFPREVQGKEPGLEGIRNLAKVLKKKGPKSDTSLVFRYEINRPVNACDDRPELRVRIKANGQFTLEQGRSWSESEENGPTFMQGKLGRAEWDTLFTKLSKMAWSSADRQLPMPGHAESHYSLNLFHAKDSAHFDIAGTTPPGENDIEAGLGSVYPLFDLPLDTLWSLFLDIPQAKRTGGNIVLQARWRNAGRVPVELQLPDSTNPPACGSMEMRWWQNPETAKKLGTGERYRAASKAAPRKAPEWRVIPPKGSVEETWTFPIQGTIDSPQYGQVTHLGIPIRWSGNPGGAAIVTLFSSIFDFQ